MDFGYIFKALKINPLAKKYTWRFFKTLVAFKAPLIDTYACTWIYVAQEPCLLISWSTRLAATISIKPLRKTYGIPCGSVGLTIPNGLNSITISASNIWGTTRRHIDLHSVTFDAGTERAVQTSPYIKAISLSIGKGYNLLPKPLQLRKSLTEIQVATKIVGIRPSSIHYDNLPQA